MLIVTIEKRDALTGEQTTLYRYAVINDGTGNSAVGHYDIRPMVGDRVIAGNNWRVTWFDRLQHNGALRLVGRALRLIDEHN